MPYPTLQQYNEALQYPNRALRDPRLKIGTVKKTNLGLPFAVSGGFALTYQISCGAEKYALRCFQKQYTDLQQRYREISRKLEAIQSAYFVKCNFQPQGVLVNGTWYPVVKMDWAGGETLGEFIEKNYKNKDYLRNLISAFEQLALYLDHQSIAHGDIQPGNVMVSNGGKTLQLIDYDGMYLPTLSTLGSSEFGLRNFQHPNRTSTSWDQTLDRFSFIALNIAFRALELEPNLWNKTNSDSETILFAASDYQNPGSSAVFAELFGKYQIEKDARAFAAICKSSFSQIPTLSDFVATKNRSKVVIATKPTISFEKTPYSSSLKVLDSSDYYECLKYVGQRVELVGKITEVSRKKDINGNPYIFVNFGDWHEKIIKLAIWSDSLSIFDELPGRAWVDRWVSVIGLIDPEYTNTRGYKSLTITITQTNQVHFLSYPEAERRLYNQWIPTVPASHPLPNDGIPGKMPTVANSTVLKAQNQTARTQAQTQTTQPQAQTLTTQPQAQTQTTPPQAQSQTIQPQIQNQTTRPQSQTQLTSPTVASNQQISQQIQLKVSSSQTQPTHSLSAMQTQKPTTASNPQKPTSNQTAQKPSCFIATALYGQNGFETNILRNYRDEYLMNSSYGRAFVSAYYRISPHLVPIIEKSQLINNFTRLVIDGIVRSIIQRI